MRKLVPALILTALLGCGHDCHDHDHSRKDDCHCPHRVEPHLMIGPHGGLLIELGHHHEYHAEMTLDTDGRTTRLYILDHDLLPQTDKIDKVVMNMIASSIPLSYDFEMIGAAEFRIDSERLWTILRTGQWSAARIHVTTEGVPRIGYVHRG